MARQASLKVVGDTPASIFEINDRIDVDPEALANELHRIHQKKQSSSETSSALGHMRKTAAEQLGCNKEALSMIERIDAMSEDKFGDFLRSFLPMVQARSPEWLNRVRDMIDRAETETDEMEGEMG